MQQNISQPNLNTDFLASVLLDMARSGVTDIVSENSRDLFADVAVKKVAPVKVAVEQHIKPITQPKLQAKPVKQAPKIDLASHVWMLQEDAKIICVTTGTQKGKQPFNADEQTLFNNMLKAMELNSEDIGYIVVDEGLDITDHQDGLSQICRRFISSSKSELIMSFGENMCPVLMGGNVTLSGARGYGKEVGDVRYVATYAPRALLKQPLLKRLAWEDLQIAMGYLKVSADA